MLKQTVVCAHQLWRWPLRVTAPSGISGGTPFLAPLAAILLLVSLVASTAAPGNTANVTLAWDANPETNLAGYRLYHGTASRLYSGSIMVGATVLTATVSNLVAGQTYYFAVTATNIAGLESAYSAEVSYMIPLNGTVKIQMASNQQVVLTVSGLAGHTYAIQASSDFRTWTFIGNATAAAGGTFEFNDTNAPNFSKRFYRAYETLP